MGLLRTARRAAVASAVHGKVQRRQHDRWAAANQPAASPTSPVPAPTPASAPDPGPPARVDEVIVQLERLAALRDTGILTDAEFQAQKARILR